MPIKVACACGKALNVPEKLAGKKGRCPSCKQLVPIPAEPAPPPQSDTFGLAPEPEPGEKIKPLLFDQTRTRERCAQCGMYIEDGDVLCDRCAGGTAKKGAKIAAKNMKGESKQKPGERHAGEMVSWFIMPFYIIFFPFIFLIGICFPRGGDFQKKKKSDEDDENEED